MDSCEKMHWSTSFSPLSTSFDGMNSSQMSTFVRMLVERLRDNIGIEQGRVLSCEEQEF